MIRRSLRAVGAAITGEIGRDEIFVVAGLAFVAVGCWDVWRPAAFLVPGGVLLWVALPSRAPFIEHAPETAERKSRRAV